MKKEYSECFVCKKYLGNMDFQYWLERPKIKFGVPSLGMRPFVICDDCWANMEVKVLHPELFERKKMKDGGKNSGSPQA